MTPFQIYKRRLKRLLQSIFILICVLVKRVIAKIYYVYVNLCSHIIKLWSKRIDKKMHKLEMKEKLYK